MDDNLIKSGESTFDFDWFSGLCILYNIRTYD